MCYGADLPLVGDESRTTRFAMESLYRKEAEDVDIEKTVGTVDGLGSDGVGGLWE